MFQELDDLELYLLYRALNTERNLIEGLNPCGWSLRKLKAINHMLEMYDEECEKRYALKEVKA